MRHFFFFLVLLSCLFFSNEVFADCFDECMSLKNCWHKDQRYSDYCGSAEANCTRSCENQEENEKGRSDSYGAIAYSRQTGGYGYSDGQNSRAEAENLALGYCRQYNKKCRNVVWFYNSCGAVASDGHKVSWGRADSEAEAAQKALKDCQGFFKKDCEVKISHCS